MPAKPPPGKGASPADIAAFIDQAVRILRYAATLRVATKPIPGGPLQFITGDQLMRMPEPPPPGCPDPYEPLSEVYEEGLRFWAEAVALRITSDQWNEIVEAACRAVPDFPGDAIRFFEVRFEALTLVDGATLYY